MARTKHSVVKANTNFDHSCIPRIAARKSAPPLHGIPPKKRFAAEIMEEIEQLKAMRTKGAAVACEVKTEPPSDVVADSCVTFTEHEDFLIQEAAAPQNIVHHNNLLAEIAVGKTVDVYWHTEGRFYRGRVASVSPTVRWKFRICYDDGDRHWERLDRTIFNIIYNRTDVDAVEEVVLDMENEDKNTCTSDDDTPYKPPNYPRKKHKQK